MGIKTPESLLEALEKSNLLNREQLAVAKEAALQSDDARALAKALAQKNLLTRWQAGQLLSGRTSFFLGKYKLTDLLGRGGMGNVFLAEHTMMNRSVAVKMISRRLSADPASLERFLVEARAIAALDHPNIVHAYTVDNDDDRYYLVLEYVEGPDLQRMVEAEGPLDAERAADYIRQTADGLVHAHAKGMIHCDIKPSNLLVNQQGVVKILDMGMARLSHRDQPVDAENGAAQDDRLLGSVDYMAPEQAVGSLSLDHRVDIYALGCTFYFLLTGHPPFPDGTLTERILRHQTHEPPSILLERPGTPRDLVKICEKMMAKEPADRFESAIGVSQALAAWRPVPQKILRAVPLDEADNRAAAAPGASGGTGGVAAVLHRVVANLTGNRRRLAVVGAVSAVVVLAVILGLLSWPRGSASDDESANAARAREELKRRQTTQQDEDSKRWGDLKLAMDQPEPAKKAQPGPAKQPAPPSPGPKPGAPTTPGPDAKAPSQPAPSAPSPKPAAPATPGPDAKPPSQPPPPAPGPKPTPPPIPGPDAKTPPQPVPPAPPAPPATVDPFKDFPKAVDLPALPGKSDGEGPAAAGVSLARIHTAAEVPWQIGLLGGDRVLKGGRRFVLQPKDTGDKKPSWLVVLESSVRGKDQTETSVARFWRDTEALVFQWLPDAASVPADFLRNCALDVRAGGSPRPLALRKPQQVDSILLDLVRPAVFGNVAVDWLPDASHLRLEIVKLEGREGHTVNPAGPLPPKTLATLSLMRKDAKGHLVRGVEFRVNSMLRGPRLTIDLRLLYPQAAQFKQLEAMTQPARVKFEEGLRALKMAIPGAQGEAKAQMEQKLNLAEAQLWYADFFAAVHRKGRLHFRVLLDLESYQLELARSQPP